MVAALAEEGRKDPTAQHLAKVQQRGMQMGASATLKAVDNHQAVR